MTRLARLIASTGVAAVVAAALAPGATAAPAGNAGDTGLGKHDRALIAQARAHGDARVTLLVASAPRANGQVASAIAGMGGRVQFREDSIGYLRVSVPTGSADRVTGISGVDAVDVDEVIPLDDPRPDGVQPVEPQPAPGKDTPAANPYMPIADTGAVTFVADHPTWDGRGTTIGIIDTGVDLSHPALATTTTGEPKVVDWVTATDPFGDDDPTWISMETQVAGPQFTVNGAVYAAPSAASFRFGTFDERDPRLGGEVDRDVNRDGNPTGSSGIFGVLWDATTGTVWVDTDQDRSFADEDGLTDYRAGRAHGTFGTDDPATEVVEAMDFVVQTDGRNKVVNIGIPSGAHGTHVAGITSANGMLGGAMRGAAPGAQIVSVRTCLFVAGCTSHALVEGMIYAAKQADVDVINMSIGGLPALNDGNNARARLYDRLITQYNVQMFISAGNSGSGLNTIGDPSVASKVMSVGSYISNATWTSNYGSASPYEDNMHTFSSRGPREDGGFKPQIIAPGSAVSTIPTWQPQGCLAQTCPVGYAMFNGTSMASPQAAGAAALLVSAAKQAGVQHQPEQLRKAISSTARFIGHYQAHEQGNGLFDVPAAWDVLRSNVQTPDIRSSVAVDTVLSGYLATPGRGTGIYDREGVSAGDSYTREYTFTRTTGGGGTVDYDVSWRGNDGTFASAGTVALPLNKPVTFPVTVTPSTPGVHSAILNLDDPSQEGIEAQTMNTVVAAEEFTADGNYSVTEEGSIGRNQARSYFFRVPAGAPAFKVDLDAGGAEAGKGQVRFLRFHPYGVGIDGNSTPNCYNPPVSGCSTGSPLSRTVSNPMAGVWEVVVEARRTSDVLFAPYKLKASILGASVSPDPDVVESVTIRTPVARSYDITSLFGEFIGRAKGTALGSALRGVETIANHEQKTFTVQVDPGSTSLRATIGGTSDPAADLDLYVMKDGKVVGQSADGDSEESVTINNPAAGTWTVVVDGYAVPAGSTTYDYVDVFANPAFGTLVVEDQNAARPSNSTWTVPAALTAQAAPATGRILFGQVEVRTDGNVLVGSGDVVVEQVTPGAGTGSGG